MREFIRQIKPRLGAKNAFMHIHLFDACDFFGAILLTINGQRPCQKWAGEGPPVNKIIIVYDPHRAGVPRAPS